MQTLKLREIREENDLKQTNIAKILQVSQPAYAMWEIEDKIIPLDKLRCLCNYFHVSMDYVFNISKINNYKYIKELDKINIGKNIYLIRKKNNTTQTKLAQVLNTTQSTISAYESGKTLILTAFLYQLCKYFNESMDDICN